MPCDNHDQPFSAHCNIHSIKEHKYIHLKFIKEHNYALVSVQYELDL